MLLNTDHVKNYEEFENVRPARGFLKNKYSPFLGTL
jgi:hypothetical protein